MVEVCSNGGSFCTSATVFEDSNVQKCPPVEYFHLPSVCVCLSLSAKSRQGCVTFQWARSLSFQLCHRSTDTAIQSSLSSTEGCVTFQCSFTEYDHGFTVWKLDVLGRDVIIGIIGIICVLRAASSSTFLRAQASCQTKQSTPGVSGSARRWKVKLDLAAPGVVSDQTIDARS